MADVKEDAALAGFVNFRCDLALRIDNPMRAAIEGVSYHVPLLEQGEELSERRE